MISSLPRYPLCLLVVCLLYGCASRSVSQQSISRSNPDMDSLFGRYRPVYHYDTETANTTQEVWLPAVRSFAHADTEALFRALTAYKRVRIKKEMPGYRVQVFVSLDRSEANEAKNRCYSLFHPDYEVYFEYSRPNYRVKVGDFTTREEAHGLYQQARRYFPGALIVPDQITIITEATEDDLILLRRQQETRREVNKQN